jgi:hypothetical protein
MKDWILRLSKEIPNDTLKKEVNGVREWDRMKLTMFSAWVFVLVSASAYFIMSGFQFEVLITFVCVAMGSKIIDAQAKKIEK